MYASDLKHPDQSLAEKLHKLYGLNRAKSMDLGFRPPYLKLLEAFGNPHLHLPPVIHVAGTNGKGSTIAMLRSVLEASGKRVHAYTSPHLVKFNERIVLAGEQISDDDLEALIDEALRLNDGGGVTFFEVTTAMAFAAFSRAPADICLLEVGMGGRLDCTNVIEAPLACVITKIGLDHTEHLGSSYAEVAAEKAGIMKAGAPCIVGAQSDAGIKGGVLDVFGAWAEELGVVLHDVQMGVSEGAVGLSGVHQQENKRAALKVLEVIADDFQVSEEQIKSGLERAFWPGRLQKLEGNLWLDGGHNGDAGRALSHELVRWKEEGVCVHLVVGMMKGKDVQAFLGPLLPHANSVSFTSIPGEPNMMAGEDLRALYPQGEVFEDAIEAVEAIRASDPQGRILICGSLYLAGHVLGRYN